MPRAMWRMDGLPALVRAANLASLELHASLGSAPDLGIADSVVFDLDPGGSSGHS